jgi:predicted ribosome-associated RNA-binding protein Tma20
MSEQISGPVAVMGLGMATMACQSALSNAGVAAMMTVATGLTAATASCWRGMFFLQKNEQLRVDGFSGVKVFNGPGVHFINPAGYRSAKIVLGLALSAREYVRVRNTAAGEERIVAGPKLLFLGAYDEVIGGVEKLEAATSEDFIFVLDKLSGKKRVLNGPKLFVPGAQEEFSIGQGIQLLENEYLIVEARLTGVKRVIKGPTLFIPDAEDKYEQKRSAQLMQKTQYMKLKDDETGKQWVVKGECLLFPEPTWVLSPVQAVITLKGQEYLRLMDKTTGKVRVERGPKTVTLEPTEIGIEGSSKLQPETAIELKVQEFVKLMDKSTSEIRVVKGSGVVYLGGSEIVLDGGKDSGVEIDGVHAAMVRDKSTGVLRLVQEEGVFFPGPDEYVEEVQDMIRLADNEAVIVKNQQGHYSFFYGNEKRRAAEGTPRSFFLPPHSELSTQRWSRGVRRDVRDLYIQNLDCRAQYMYFEFNCRTSDNVELVLEGTFFWQVSDVPAMLKTTGDVPGDVCNHARSQFIRLVSRVTLKDFMENLHNISKEVYEEDQDFYARRGIKIRSLEITRYSCAEAKTRIILEKIIQETTNRLNRLSQAESESEVNMFTTQGRIAQETLKTQLLQIQHEQQELAAKAEGMAKAKKAAAFIAGVKHIVPELETRMDMWETLRKVDGLSMVAKANSKIYYTKSDLDLSLEFAA